MVARQIVCRIESCGECDYYSFDLHGCAHLEWPKLDPFVKDPTRIPDCCPLEMAPDESTTD